MIIIAASSCEYQCLFQSVSIALAWDLFDSVVLEFGLDGVGAHFGRVVEADDVD